MDPETRRFMWDYIASVREGRALILTTHSMEEADALCSKIGIMRSGKMACIGTRQQLKSKSSSARLIAVPAFDPRHPTRAQAVTAMATYSS